MALRNIVVRSVIESPQRRIAPRVRPFMGTASHPPPPPPPPPPPHTAPGAPPAGASKFDVDAGSGTVALSAEKTAVDEESAGMPRDDAALRGDSCPEPGEPPALWLGGGWMISGVREDDRNHSANPDYPE